MIEILGILLFIALVWVYTKISDWWIDINNNGY